MRQGTDACGALNAPWARCVGAVHVPCRRKGSRQPAVPGRHRRCLGQSRACPFWGRWTTRQVVSAKMKSFHWRRGVIQTRGRQSDHRHDDSGPDKWERKPFLPIFRTRYCTFCNACVSNMASTMRLARCHGRSADCRNRSRVGERLCQKTGSALGGVGLDVLGASVPRQVCIGDAQRRTVMSTQKNASAEAEAFFCFGRPCGIRTCDQRIKSPRESPFFDVEQYAEKPLNDGKTREKTI